MFSPPERTMQMAGFVAARDLMQIGKNQTHLCPSFLRLDNPVLLDIALCVRRVAPTNSRVSKNGGWMKKSSSHHFLLYRSRLLVTIG